MKRQKVLLLFGGFAGVCLIAIAVLAFTTWKLSTDLKEMKAAQSPEITSPFGTLPSPWKKGLDPWSNDWDPSGHFSDLQKRMDEMMNAMSPGSSFFNKQGFGYSSTSPTVEMEETPDQYEIVVKVPEGQEIEVNTELKDGQLTISGKVKSEAENTQGGHSSRVFQTSQFSQSVYLSEAVDESGMRVEHDKHQFTITVPKAQ